MSLLQKTSMIPFILQTRCGSKQQSRAFVLVLVLFLVSFSPIHAQEEAPPMVYSTIDESNYMHYYGMLKAFHDGAFPPCLADAGFSPEMVEKQLSGRGSSDAKAKLIRQIEAAIIQRGRERFPNSVPHSYSGHVSWRYTGQSDEDYFQWGTLSGDNWMNFIGDEQLVRDITIPGSHDSFTWPLRGGGPIAQCAVTQRWNVEQQFHFGCRFFDVRLDADNGGIQHYIAHVGIDAHEALGRLVACVRNHPSEGVFVVLKREAGEGRNLPATILRQWRLCQSNWASGAERGVLSEDEFTELFVPLTDSLKMKDIRGKICLIYRDRFQRDDPRDELAWQQMAGTYLHFGEGSYEGEDFYGRTIRMYCQDYYGSVDVARKVEALTTAMGIKSGNLPSAATGSPVPPGQLWMFCHASGYTGSSLSISYNRCAHYVMSDEEGRGSWFLRTQFGPFGFLIQDFFGAESFDPGFLSKERETHGRHFSSYAWQHNFYEANGRSSVDSQYYVMSESEGDPQWDTASHPYRY